MRPQLYAYDQYLPGQRHGPYTAALRIRLEVNELISLEHVLYELQRAHQELRAEILRDIENQNVARLEAEADGEG